MMRILISLGVGALAGAAHILPYLPLLAWAVPGLFLMMGLGASWRARLAAGWIAGMAYMLVGGAWMLNIPFRSLALAVWIGIALFQGLLFGAWLLFAGGLAASSPGERGKPGPVLVSTGAALAAAAAWVALEMISCRIGPDLPYSLAATQWSFTPLIQISSLTGPYGLSFLMAWCSMEAMSRIWGRRQGVPWGRQSPGKLAVPAAVLGLALLFGFLRIREPSDPLGTVRVALVQPDLWRPRPWTEPEKTEAFQRLVAFTDAQLDRPCDLVVWPEAPIPNFISRYNALVYSSITNLVQRRETALLFGGTEYEPVLRNGEKKVLRYNQAFLMDAQGRGSGSYSKRHLVMIGEYLPLAGYLPGLRNALRLDMAFTPGGPVSRLELTRPPARFGVLICAEDLYPHEVREHVRERPQFLVNLTNDRWFGAGRAQWAHLAGSVLRAAEHGIPVLRCANNGITAWIDETGRLREWLREPTPYHPGILHVDLPLRSARPTLYTRFGDLFGWTAVAVTVGIAGGRSVRAWRRRTPGRKRA